MKHARDYYRTNHGENKEAGCINDALAVMQEQGYGREPAGIFRPRDLKKVRDAMAGHFMSVRPLLVQALATAKNPFLETVPSYAVNKPAVHHTIINEGGGGTVWKQIDAIYEPGRRVKHWLKRKRSIEVEAFVSGFKPGTPGRGNEHRVGAVEFSIVEEGGMTRPVAWISSWTVEERQRITQHLCAGRELNSIRTTLDARQL